MDEGASVSELHDAYIRHFVPTETLRAGLRSLASHLHETLRTSMSRLDTNLILHSPELDLASGQIDKLLICQLLGIESHPRPVQSRASRPVPGR